MENLSEIKQLHQKVQQDIFRILIEYKVLVPVATSLPSKTSMYFFAEDYRFYVYEMPMELGVYLNSVNRLLETNFFQMASVPHMLDLCFVKSEEYELLNREEKANITPVPHRDVKEMILTERKFSFSDEIL